MLEAVGLSSQDETLYVTLIDHPGITLAELSRRARISSAAVMRRLPILEAMGLITRSADRPVRYRPASPQVAGRVLILRQQEALERAQLVFADLDGRLRQADRSRADHHLSESVEVVIGPSAVAQRAAQVFQSAREEIVGLDKPPYAADTEAVHDHQVGFMDAGLSVRSVYDPEGLGVDRLALLQRMVRAGEQARTASVPTKLLIADRSLALLPLHVGTSVESALLVHPSNLLDVLVDLFERIWRSAGELPGSKAVASGVGPADQRLLTLLSAGYKAEAVAYQLSVSRQAVQRRVRRLMRQLDVQTLFQFGQRAAQQGWLAGDADEDPSAASRYRYWRFCASRTAARTSAGRSTTWTSIPSRCTASALQVLPPQTLAAS